MIGTPQGKSIILAVYSFKLYKSTKLPESNMDYARYNIWIWYFEIVLFYHYVYNTECVTTVGDHTACKCRTFRWFSALPQYTYVDILTVSYFYTRKKETFTEMFNDFMRPPYYYSRHRILKRATATATLALLKRAERRHRHFVKRFFFFRRRKSKQIRALPSVTGP